MKYIVFWVAVNLITVPCSSPVSQVDEYGRANYSLHTTLAIHCWVTQRVEHKREFETIEAAQAFIDGAEIGGKNQILSYGTSSLEDFRIEKVEPIKTD